MPMRIQACQTTLHVPFMHLGQTLPACGAQVRSQNMTNELKHAFGQMVAAACEAGGASPTSELDSLAPLTVHLFRRCLHTLLSSVSICGSAKVAAFRTLLQYERFWVAAFGACAEVVIATQWPAELEAPRVCRHAMWQCAAYDMWHALRCAPPLYIAPTITTDLQHAR